MKKLGPVATAAVMMAELDHVILERMMIQVNQEIPMSAVMMRNTVEVQSYIENTLRSLVYQLSAWVLRGENKQTMTGTYTTPKTWWEMFKLESMPKWFLDHFPVKYKTRTYQYEQTINVCPHADMAWPDDRHIKFMIARKNKNA